MRKIALLISLLVVSMLSCTLSAKESVKKPCGSGTEDCPFHIKTAGEMLYFASVVNGGVDTIPQNTGACAVLDDDIDMSTVCSEELGSWMPIGIDNNRYTGVFNGHNHTINNIYIDGLNFEGQGLFGRISKAEIRNLIMGPGLISSKNPSVGGIVGVGSGTIVDCHNYANIYCSSKFNGGIIGYMGSDSRIEKCHNEGLITGTSSASDLFGVGGIAGAVSKNSVVSDCYNLGDISGRSSRVGGVVGSAENCLVTNCFSYGSVESKANDYGGGLCAIAPSYPNTKVEHGYYFNPLDKTGQQPEMQRPESDFHDGTILNLLKEQNPSLWRQEGNLYPAFVDTVFNTIVYTKEKVTLCEGQSVVFNGQEITEAGLYTSESCDCGGDTLIVTLTEAVKKSITETICTGTSYKLGTQTLTKSGVYEETFVSASGCDSVVTLTLNVLDKITKSITESICPGSSYVLGIQTLTKSGVYEETFVSASGCDSVVTLTLNVLDKITKSITESICPGSSYVLGTQTLTKSGVYEETFVSKSGCDSVVTLTLNVLDKITKSVTESICPGSSYVLGTQTLTEAGVYTETFVSAAGCDSVVTLTLKVLDKVTKEISETICPGSSYVLGTQTLTEAGVYEETFVSAAGCDSVVTLTLNVLDKITKSITESICPGSSYVLGTQTLTESGVYTETFVSAAGCDSVVTLTLKVLDKVTKEISETICPGSSYVLGTQTLTKSGVYVETFVSAAGCDSVVTLTLNVLDKITKSITESICPGSSYVLGTQTLTEAGVYEETFVGASGCDSVVTLTLKVLDKVTKEISESICPGSSYVLGTQTLTEAGVYEETFVSAAGCDSVVTLTLNVLDKITKSITESICPGSSYVLGTQTLTEAGVYEETFVSASGCDSVVTLTLNVLDKVTKSITESICPGSSYVLGTQTLTEAGVYEETFVSATGCDSVVTLTLKVLDKVTKEITESICPGSSYVLGTQTLTESGVYEETFVSAAGCDSVVTLTLKVLDKVTKEITESICPGSSYVLGTQTLTEAGVYEETFVSATGCDSVVTLTLKVLDKVTKEISESICPGSSYVLGTQTLTESGVYEETFVSATGCDSVVTLTLKVLDKVTKEITESICPGSSYVLGTQTLTEAGVYEETFVSAAGCDSVVTLTLKVLEPIEVEVEEIICQGSVYNFDDKDLSESGTYKATFVSVAGCDSVVTLHLLVAQPTYYVVKDTIVEGDEYVANGFEITDYHLGINEYDFVLVNQFGCDSMVTYQLFVKKKLNPIIPGVVVTPNGDGVNDTWEIVNLSDYTKYSVKIFDRWGKLLVNYKNEYPGWDGYYNGSKMMSSDYWYVIDIEELDKVYHGHFTLSWDNND